MENSYIKQIQKFYLISDFVAMLYAYLHSKQKQ